MGVVWALLTLTIDFKKQSFVRAVLREALLSSLVSPLVVITFLASSFMKENFYSRTLIRYAIDAFFVWMRVVMADFASSVDQDDLIPRMALVGYAARVICVRVSVVGAWLTISIYFEYLSVNCAVRGEASLTCLISFRVFCAGLTGAVF